MLCKIDKVIRKSVGTTAVSFPVNGLACIVKNNSADATIFIKDAEVDGVKASAANGYPLAAGQSTPVPLVAVDLSVVADKASTDVCVMLIDEG